MDRTHAVRECLEQAAHAPCVTLANGAADGRTSDAADVAARAPKNGCRALRGHG